MAIKLEMLEQFGDLSFEFFEEINEFRRKCNNVLHNRGNASSEDSLAIAKLCSRLLEFVFGVLVKPANSGFPGMGGLWLRTFPEEHPVIKRFQREGFFGNQNLEVS
jgi:hypothetical protein